MNWRRSRAFAFLIAATVSAQEPTANPPASTAANDRVERPRLVVLCSVDQLASWVFEQAKPHFAADGGFRRLAREGVFFSQCAFEHGCTETGPGHATISTGVSARVHGIVRNDWWSDAALRSVYCVEGQAAALPEWPEGKNRGPDLLAVPTFGTALKAHVIGSKVVGIAWKDRSAILLAGGSADVAAWFESSTGNLVTNTRYCQEAPAWLRTFHGERAIDRLFGTTWERSGPDAAYRGLVDDRPFETAHCNGSQARTLPQPLTGGGTAPSSVFYAQIYASPFGNTMVRLAAEAAIRGEALGQDDATDLLGVSFSSTDVMGHTFGPESVEARDGLLRLDRELALFFASLDEIVGAGRWALFLTADHGVGPTPEAIAPRGVDAGRGLIQTMVKAAGEKALRDRFGPPAQGQPYLAFVGDFSCFLAGPPLRAVAGSRGEAEVRAEAASLVAAAAARVRGVAMALPTRDLVASGDRDRLLSSLREALHPGRAGEVQLVLKPYWVDSTVPATHGSPHPYDREVVAFAIGPGIARGVRIDAPITPGCGVPLFARLCGVPPPVAPADVLPPGLLLP
jgi:hypothetical protein